MERKTFDDLKKGDELYIVECSNIDCKFNKTYVRDFLFRFCTDDTKEIYISDSPMSFSFDRNASSWHGIIFTTKEEAMQSAKKQINEKVKEHLEYVNMFNDFLTNIDEIEFKDTNK